MFAWLSAPFRRPLIGGICLGALLLAAPPAASQDGTTSSGLEPIDESYFPFTRNQVIEMKEFLSRLGYSVGAIDGEVGHELVAAAKGLATTLETEFVRKASGHERILDCKIEEGAPQDASSDILAPKILIDEYRRILVYNFSEAAVSELNPIRKSGSGYIDLSMKITANNDRFILADDDTSAIVITKDDGRFAYSFAQPYPLDDGSFLAFGNSLSGTCARNPFR